MTQFTPKRKHPTKRPSRDLITQEKHTFRKLNVINREVWSISKRQSLWNDFYYASMTTTWPRFIAATIFAFIVINILFALLYALNVTGINNVPPEKPWWVFFFSVETFATVGYGNMNPNSNYTHWMASAESLIGLLFSAVMTGLVFARFARPRAKFVFSDKAVINNHNGQLVWSARVANERHNQIEGANAQLWFLRNEILDNGEPFRRFYNLKLRQPNNPIFVLSWTLMHEIDAESPLYGLSAQDLEACEGLFILRIKGADETVSQNVTARHNYQPADIVWDAQFEDMLHTDDQGLLIIDMQKLGEIRS